MKVLAKVAGGIGIALAVITAFVAVPYAPLVIAIAGAVIGIIAVPDSYKVEFLVVAIALAGATAGLAVLPTVGGYITDIMSNLSSFYQAAVVTVVLKHIYTKLTA